MAAPATQSVIIQSVIKEEAKEDDDTEVKESVAAFEKSYPNFGAHLRMSQFDQNLLNTNNPHYPRRIHKSTNLAVYQNDVVKGCERCGYLFKHPAVPIAIDYKHGFYTIKDVFCSPVCAKEHIPVGMDSQRRGSVYTWQTNMLENVFKYYEVVPAFPKKLFKRYGGTWTHKKFLKVYNSGFANAAAKSIVLRSLPFIEAPQVVEEEFFDTDIERAKIMPSAATLAEAAGGENKNNNIKKSSCTILKGTSLLTAKRPVSSSLSLDHEEEPEKPKPSRKRKAATTAIKKDTTEKKKKQKKKVAEEKDLIE
jgi:hypothetical protein